MFKVGDTVRAINSDYGFAPHGSLGRVTDVCSETVMTIEIITVPSGYRSLGPYNVYIRDFVLEHSAEPVKPVIMKIEELKIYTCQKQLPSGYPCDELAEHRISIPGLAVTFCHSHAQPYLSGDEKLEAIKCKLCQKICRPGAWVSHDYGYRFCGVGCEEAYIHQGSGSHYAGASS